MQEAALDIFAVSAGGGRESCMKRQRHKHKESFSILLISNTGRTGRQFHFSLLAFRLFLAALLLSCIAFGWLAWEFSNLRREHKDLSGQLASALGQVQKLEDEYTALDNEKQSLASENQALQEAIRTSAQAAQEKEAEEAAREKEAETPPQDPSFPSRYPSTDTGMLISPYSEEQPYLSLNTHAQGKIIAAGDGVVASVTSDGTYPVIIELEPGNGYRTRYMCRQEAHPGFEEGAQVKGGDTLLDVTIDNTQLDYQVFLDGTPIDPLIVLDAKG